MKARTVAQELSQEIRKMTRLQLQEAFLKMRQESRDARSEKGEAVRSAERAHGAVAVLTAALEAIAHIADCRSQHATDAWSLVEDLARNALRKSSP